jgi:hypothetical protein
MRTFHPSLVSAAAMAALCSSAAFAQAPINTPPTLNITSPTGTIYSAVFPFTQPVATQITMNAGELASLTGFNVKIDNVSITGNLNPYDINNQCTTAVTTNGNTCSFTSSTAGTVTVPWSVPSIGTYTITVVARYINALGSDEEQVTVANSNIEYPAPPAVANAYINSTGWRTTLTGKQRGCVISKIAEDHGKTSAYGPKGGPYDINAIQQAVGSFAGSCPA